MNFISFLFFKFFVIVIGILPFRVLYLLSDVFAFVLYRIIGYRKGVIFRNLENAFPEKGKEEIKRIVGQTYKNLADITLEGFKAFTMDKEEIARRYKITNRDLVLSYFKNGKSVMMLGAHYNNWEWGTSALPVHLDFSEQSVESNIVIIYKPLANGYMDKYMKRVRKKAGAVLATLRETGYYFNKYVNKNTGFILIADQNPSNKTKSVWVNFFGRETPFLRGAEILSRKYDIPVLFGEVTRVKRGYYEYKFYVLAENPAEYGSGKITELYAMKLESIIRKQPANWLWSHKRWKHAKEGQN
jgi:KDO2-lipid IV(A) lauroyltransferase